MVMARCPRWHYFFSCSWLRCPWRSLCCYVVVLLCCCELGLEAKNIYVCAGAAHVAWWLPSPAIAAPAAAGGVGGLGLGIEVNGAWCPSSRHQEQPWNANHCKPKTQIRFCGAWPISTTTAAAAVAFPGLGTTMPTCTCNNRSNPINATSTCAPCPCFVPPAPVSCPLPLPASCSI